MSRENALARSPGRLPAATLVSGVWSDIAMLPQMLSLAVAAARPMSPLRPT